MANKKRDTGRASGARLSQRKRAIVEMLADATPSGVMLQNELRHKVFRESGSKIQQFHFNRSFNRTVQHHGAPHLYRFPVSIGSSALLTAGIAARFGMWQLVEKGYASEAPAPAASIVVVGGGNSAVLATFAILATLVDDTRVLLYSGEVQRVAFVSASDALDASALRTIEKVPWTLYRVNDDGKLAKTAADVLAGKLNRLPEFAVWSDGTQQCLRRRENAFLFDT